MYFFVFAVSVLANSNLSAISFIDEYYFTQDTLLWGEADFDCNSRGGYLTSILSEDESNFLTAELKRRDIRDAFWIGLFPFVYHYTNCSSFDKNLGSQKKIEIA